MSGQHLADYVGDRGVSAVSAVASDDSELFLSLSLLTSYSFSSRGFPEPKMDERCIVSVTSLTTFTLRGLRFSLGRLPRSSV